MQKNTIQYKTYNEVQWGNEQLTDIVCCDWEETFICLWEEHVCSHMSQQKESDGGISPGAGALERSEGRKCGPPQRSEHLFPWPFHSPAWKGYYRCFCTAEWGINKQQSEQVLCKMISDIWFFCVSGHEQPQAGQFQADSACQALGWAAAAPQRSLSWALWKPSVGSSDDASMPAGVNPLGSGDFPAQLLFVQDASLGSLRSALLGVTPTFHSTPASTIAVNNCWI